MKEFYDYIEIEKEIQNLWAQRKSYEANIDTTKPKYYCLSMLPYPSGNLHINPFNLLYLDMASPIE